MMTKKRQSEAIPAIKRSHYAAVWGVNVAAVPTK
jgi:hypothetical protein